LRHSYPSWRRGETPPHLADVVPLRRRVRGFVAFSTYLPTYLKNVYNFGLTEAGTRTAGFAIAAVIARPIGGIVADKIGPRTVVRHSPCRGCGHVGDHRAAAATRDPGWHVIRLSWRSSWDSARAVFSPG
jgi:hypothetical protein